MRKILVALLMALWMVTRGKRSMHLPNKTSTRIFAVDQHWKSFTNASVILKSGFQAGE